MTAPRGAILAAVLLLGATFLRASQPADADPHELFEKARERLSTGDLEGCAAAISRLQALIARQPRWDPEGTFTKDLLPPLLAGVRRLEDAAGKLDEFSRRALREAKPPEPGRDIDTVRDYTQWATSVVQRLRAERDSLIEAALPDPGERAVLTRTESYARTERVLEIDLLAKLADAAGDDVLGLLTGNPEMESVLVRFRQLKRELIQIAAERDDLRQRVRESDQRLQALLDTLAVVVTDGASIRAEPGEKKASSPGERFSRFLDAEREALRGRSAITPADRAALRSSLDRYQRYNQALLAAGFGSDQSKSLRALAKAVEEAPVGEGTSATPSTPGWMSALILISLATGAGYLARIAIVRRKRVASPPGHGLEPLRGIAVPVDEADAGRDAA